MLIVHALAPILPIISFLGFLWIFRLLLTSSWREAALFACVAWGALVLGLTELLGAFHVLVFPVVLGSWLAVLSGIVGVFIRRRLFSGGNVLIGKGLPSLGAGDKVVLGLVLVIVVLTAVTACVCPPNTYDSMTYHMARIAHWVQNKTVDYYPTHNLRQLVTPAWMEYAALHFQILSAGDYFANSIQWVSMLGCLIGVSLIARDMGAGVFGQIVSVFVAVTIPMGIIQASSLQGDYAAALWIVCAMAMLVSRELSWIRIMCFSLSMGLACATKGTGSIFAVPLAVWFLVAIRGHLGKAGLCLMIVLAVMSGYLFRNSQLFPGNVFSAAEVHGVNVALRDISWSTIVANAARNVGTHLGTSSADVNRITDDFLSKICSFLGGTIHDPKATFGDARFSVLIPSRNENFVTNGLHLLLFAGCFLWLLLFVKTPRILGYMAAVVGMWLMLVVLVRWQPWISRFHLPLFVLGAPMAGLVCDRLKARGLVAVILAGIFLSCVPYVINAHPRHLLGQKTFLSKSRIENVFMERPYWRTLYAEAIAHAASQGCVNIGLVMGGDAWDYPFYLIFNPLQDPQRRMEHVLVDNVSVGLKYPLGKFFPCAIIGFSGGRELRWEGRAFRLSYEYGDVKVFQPDESFPD